MSTFASAAYGSSMTSHCATPRGVAPAAKIQWSDAFVAHGGDGQRARGFDARLDDDVGTEHLGNEWPRGAEVGTPQRLHARGGHRLHAGHGRGAAIGIHGDRDIDRRASRVRERESLVVELDGGGRSRAEPGNGTGAGARHRHDVGRHCLAS
jgi:hypothetical protein